MCMPRYGEAPENREKIRIQIEYKLDSGVIERAEIESVSPVFLAPKWTERCDSANGSDV